MSQLEDTIRSMKYDDKGLLTAVVVDAETKDVLMVAFMNDKALLDTIRTGKTHFWSRSRQKYWMKGESSGHVQDVKAVYTDCDKDAIVVEVTQHGGACHEGYRSCFYRRLSEAGKLEVIAEKVFEPENVYKKGQ